MPGKIITHNKQNKPLKHKQSINKALIIVSVFTALPGTCNFKFKQLNSKQVHVHANYILGVWIFEVFQIL